MHQNQPILGLFICAGGVSALHATVELLFFYTSACLLKCAYNNTPLSC